jgi:YD repeat-containing protein
MRVGIVTAGHPVNVATGAVYSTHEDFAVPGQARLTWERRYDTSLLGAPATHLGLGWTIRYAGALVREGDAYRFMMAEGGEEVFLDPTGLVERGEVIRHLGTFQELTRRSDGYVITRWGPGGQAPERLVFAPRPNGVPMPLVTIENAVSAALDLLYDRYGRLARVQQRLAGRALEPRYSSATGRIDAVDFVGADGATLTVVRYEYDGGGRLIAAVNAMEHAERYEYDGAGRVVREIRKDGSVYSFRYDDAGRCVRSSGLDRYDEKTFKYRDAIRWTEVTDSLGHVTRYQWLPTGQVVAIVDPLGGIQTTEYDDEGRIVAVVSPGGGRTQYGYDAAGNGVLTVDPAGNAWTQRFDANHLRVAETDPLGRTSQWHHDGAGRIVAVDVPSGGRFEYRFDEVGNLLEARTARGVYKRFGYDARGNLVEVIDAAGNVSRFTLDVFGRLAQAVNAAGFRYRVGYDILGNTTLIQYHDGTTELFVYDAGGNQVAATDRNGHTRTFRWGPCRRLLEAMDANGRTVRFVWGSEPDRLEQVINERGETYRYEYDAAGRATKHVSFDGRERSFRFDADGRVIAVENGVGETITYHWDSCGRLLERRLPTGESHALTYDACGDILSAATPEVALRFERDAVGRVVREVQGDHVVESAYDIEGNRIRVATDLGYLVEYELDAGLHLRRLVLGTGDAFSFA